jgi:hypothetical protein
MAVAMKAGDVQENVSKAIVGNDKSVALSHIEPFNPARQLDNARLFRYSGAPAYARSFGQARCDRYSVTLP